MQKIFILLLISLSLFATGTQKSPVALPQSYYIDVDSRECNKYCLIDMINKGNIFSFLAKYSAATDKDATVTSQHAYYSGVLNAKEIKFVDSTAVATSTPIDDGTDLFSNILNEDSGTKIALLVPSRVVGAYATSVSNAIVSYLLNSGADFKYEVFDAYNEDEISLKREIGKLRSLGYTYVVAVVTKKGANIIASEAHSGLSFYIPTLHQNDMLMANNNIIFGGIDYNAQLQSLSEHANDKTVNISYNNMLGRKLHTETENIFSNVIFSQMMSRKQANYKSLVRSHKTVLNNATIVLNTPIVQSSLIMSQLRYYGVNPYTILASQLAYQPRIFSLSQSEDTKKLLIANAISKVDSNIDVINSIFGNNIAYSWLDYASSIGVEYFLQQSGDVYNTLFDEYIDNNQVNYRVNIVKPTGSKFQSVN